MTRRVGIRGYVCCFAAVAKSLLAVKFRSAAHAVVPESCGRNCAFKDSASHESNWWCLGSNPRSGARGARKGGAREAFFEAGTVEVLLIVPVLLQGLQVEVSFSRKQQERSVRRKWKREKIGLMDSRATQVVMR